MAKNMRGRHDDAENQSGGFPVGDEDAGIRSEAAESSLANGGGAADASASAAGAGLNDV